MSEQLTVKQKQQKAINFLDDLHDRAVTAMSHNNQLGAAYMACITGMWTHSLHAPDVNPFKGEIV